MAMEHTALRNKIGLISAALLLVVIVVFLFSTGISIPPHRLSKQTQKNLMARMQVSVSAEGALRYRDKFDHLPINAKQLYEGIQLLRPSAETVKGWINDAGEIIDPWGKPLMIERHADGFSIKSMGADGQSNTGDDIIETRQ